MAKNKVSAIRDAMRTRPMPPKEIFDPVGKLFHAAPDVLAWAQEQILKDGAPLYNEDHKHLEFADIAFMWAESGFVKAGRTVLGQCEEITFRCGLWQKGRQQQQMVEWFGHVPDYLITLDAKFCIECSDADFCALVEHELYHIGHLLDEYGQPAYGKWGDPKLGIRGHDVEEFTGVVRRYGASADVAKMVEAANKMPEVSKLNIARACGTCLLKSA
jgi:hypothetical protein